MMNSYKVDEKRLKILVVDDSLMMRNNIKSYVESSGNYVIGEATNGIAAIDICREKNPDIITMDIAMPDMDGFEAISEIRRFNKSVNILVVTSHGQEEVIMKSLKAGAKGYILKPVTQENLEQAIENIYNDIHTSKKHEYLLDE